MRVVVAPDKFKGSATAAEVAAALAAGLRRERPDLEIAEMPVADGGDGTVAAVLDAGFAPVLTTAEGPTGESVHATFALKAGTAVIELADVAGLRRLPGERFAPLTASTYGVGQVIAAALDCGATTIVLGIGGSATTDGGAGMVQALGVRLADERGRDLARGGSVLSDLAAVDLAGLDGRIAGVRLRVASDVDNPLLGPAGAAAVFGPQKGAARGTGFAAMTYLGARLVPGADLVLGLIGFDAALTGAGLVITGEGSLDRQSLGGKAPVGVARAAARHGVPVAVVAGRILLTAQELAAAGFAAAYSLADLEPSQAASMATATEPLEQIGGRVALGPLVTAVT